MNFLTNCVRPNPHLFVVEMCIYVHVCMCPTSDFVSLNKPFLKHVAVLFEVTGEDFSDTMKSE